MQPHQDGPAADEAYHEAVCLELRVAAEEAHLSECQAFVDENDVGDQSATSVAPAAEASQFVACSSSHGQPAGACAAECPWDLSDEDPVSVVEQSSLIAAPGTEGAAQPLPSFPQAGHRTAHGSVLEEGLGSAREGLPGRGSEAIEWHSWTITPVKLAGNQIGWRGHCLCHGDEDNQLACRKDIHFGDGPGQLSSEDCLRLVKQWLLRGRSISRELPRARHVHVHGEKLRLYASMSDEELERAAEPS